MIENSDDHLTGNVSFLNLGSGDVRTGSGGHHGPYKTLYEAAGAAFTADGRSVVTAGNDSRLLIWDVATASTRTALAKSGDLPLRGPVLSVEQLRLLQAAREDRRRRPVVLRGTEHDDRVGVHHVSGVVGVRRLPDGDACRDEDPQDAQ